MELLHSVWRSLFRHKTRSLLTIAGIAVGIFSVVIIGVIAAAGKLALTDEMSKMGMDSVTIQPNFEIGGRLSARELSVVKNFDGVEEASPLLIQYNDVQYHSGQCKAVVLGVDETAGSIVSLELRHGRLLTHADITQKRDVCIVNEAFAKSVYRRTNIVGKKIRILFQGIPRTFEVVGVAETGGNLMQGMMGESIPNFLYMPYTVHQQYSSLQSYDSIAVRLETGADSQAIGEELGREIIGLSGIPDSVKVENLSSYKRQFEQILDGASLVLALIAGISLLVAGLSIMTMMLTAVSERTREIGVKKSIGATSGRIVFEFLTESAILSLLGGAIGMAIGLALGFVGCWVLGATFVVDTGLLLGCLIFSLATGVIFGAYPAAQAAKLAPVEALRQE